MKTLRSMQKDLCELQIQTGQIHVSMGQVSGIQMSLEQASTSVLDTDKTLDLRVIPLLLGLH